MDLKNIPKKLVGNDEERAVSPVIGIILMVAITVILAAVIAAFVLDLGDSIDSEAQAGATVDGDGTDNVTVTITSMSDADGVYIAGPDGEILNSSEVANLNSGWANTTSTGTTWEFEGGSSTNETDPGTYSVIGTLNGDNPDAETTTSIQTFEITD